MSDSRTAKLHKVLRRRPGPAPAEGTTTIRGRSPGEMPVMEIMEPSPSHRLPLPMSQTTGLSRLYGLRVLIE